MRDINVGHTDRSIELFSEYDKDLQRSIHFLLLLFLRAFLYMKTVFSTMRKGLEG
jgi:hypothetical protein